MIRWYDVPWSEVSAAFTERVFVGPLVVFPTLPVNPIIGSYLPGLILILLTFQQALLLFISADVEEKLENDGVVVCQQLLKVINFFVATAPRAGWCC